jgi:drug/metabolite transporter superfamily protein YnfA
MGSFIVEFWSFLREHKKLWLVPMLIIMALFGVVLTQIPAVAPFIYALF